MKETVNKAIMANNDVNTYNQLKNIHKINKRIYKKLEKIESKIGQVLSDYEQNKNNNFLIINRLENIADFLRNNYNVVIEEREIFNFNPHDD